MASSGRRARNEADVQDFIRATRGELTSRDMAMLGFAPDTKKAIATAIELSPALEEAILNIADLAYRDGQDSA